MVALSFNAAQHEPSTSQPVLPEGWYSAIITATETKRAKAKAGQQENPNNVFLACTTRLVDQGVDVINRFNLWNDNPEAVRIANGQFSKLLHVLGIFGECPDSQMIHNKPFQIKITVQKDDAGRTNNNYTDYRYSDGREWAKNPGNAPQGAPPPNMQSAPPQPPAYGQAPGNFAPPAPPPGYPPPAGQPPGYPPASGQPPAPGYPPPAAPGGFPQAAGYGAPQGYPPPAGPLPGAPAGYPQPGASPAPGGYPQPPAAGFPQPGQAPAGYGAPPAPVGPTPGYPPPAGGAPGAWPGQPPR